MTEPSKLAVLGLTAIIAASCGRETTPTAPSAQASFLAGTWRGTVTIQVNPRDPNPPPPTSGEMTWTFEVIPQTDMRSLRATIRSSHPWLTMETTGSTAVSPSNSPPTQISTQGEFNSPRGCRGTFSSVGRAEADRIDTDFTGTDCQASTFTGQLQLTKNGS